MSSSYSSTDSESSLSSYTHDMACYHESLFLQAETLQRQFLDNRRNGKPEPVPAVKESGIQRMHAKKQALGQFAPKRESGSRSS